MSGAVLHAPERYSEIKATGFELRQIETLEAERDRSDGAGTEGSAAISLLIRTNTNPPFL